MVGDGVSWGEGGLPGDAAANAMLCLLVCRQRPCRQVCRSVWAPGALSLTGLVGCPLPRNTFCVGCVGVPANDVTRLVHHPDHLSGIRLQAHPVKQPC